MTRRLLVGLIALGAAGVWTVATDAQQKKADWLTDGGDPQRTAWQRNETILTKANVKEVKLLWKIQLDNQPRQMHSLFPPLIAGNVSTAASTKEIAIVAGVSDTIYGVDVDSGKLLWKKHFDSTFQEQTGGRGGGTLCPGGLTATPVLDQPSPGKYIAYAVSWDGRLRKLDVATGEEIEPPALFLPPNGKPYALNLVNGVIYTTTAQGCGGNPNNFYSYDLATTLKQKASVTIPDADFRSSPLVFQWKDKDVVAAAGKGTLYLFESTALSRGPIATAGLPGSGKFEAGALATWVDAQNVRWLAAPSARAIVTFKVVEADGKTAIQQGWTSRDIASPLPPLVVNGVLFTVSTGSKLVPSVLYAIDASSGNVLWNSGRTITTSVKGGLSAGQGNVYVPGGDGTLYAFGFAIEK